MVLSMRLSIRLTRCGSVEKVDIDAVLAEIRTDVARRRAEGSYPPGLENELEAEFRNILALTSRGETARQQELLELIGQMQEGLRNLSGLTVADSRIPGGSIVHRVIRRLIARHTMGIADQVRRTAEPMARIVEIVAEESAGREDADRRMVVALSKHVLDRVAVVDHLALLSAELEARIGRLESGE